MVNNWRLGSELLVWGLLVAVSVTCVVEFVILIIVVNLVTSLLLRKQVVVVHGKVVFLMLLLLLVLLDLVSDLFAVNLNSIISSVTAVLVLVVNALCGLLGYWGFHLGWGYFKFHWKLLCNAWFNAWTLINALSDHASGSRLACWLDAASSGESFVKIWVFGRGKNLLTCHSLFGRRLNNRLFLGLSLNGRSLNNWFFLLVLVLNGGTLLQNWFGVLKCILSSMTLASIFFVCSSAWEHFSLISTIYA